MLFVTQSPSSSFPSPFLPPILSHFLTSLLLPSSLLAFLFPFSSSPSLHSLPSLLSSPQKFGEESPISLLIYCWCAWNHVTLRIAYGTGYTVSVTILSFAATLGFHRKKRSKCEYFAVVSTVLKPLLSGGMSVTLPMP